MPSDPTPFEPPKDPPQVTGEPSRYGLRHLRCSLFGLFVATIPSLFGLQWLSNSPRFLDQSGFTEPQVEGWVGVLVGLDMALLGGAWLISRVERWAVLSSSFFDEY